MPERPEMPDAQVRIDGYRERALQLLAIAQTLYAAGPRSTVLMTAQDYLRMADSLEKSLRSEPSAQVSRPTATSENRPRR